MISMLPYLYRLGLNDERDWRSVVYQRDFFFIYTSEPRQVEGATIEKVRHDWL